MNTFDVGETVICSVEVKDDTGAYKDPATSMQIKIDQIKSQFASKITATDMTPDSTGKYHYDLQTTGYKDGTYEAIYIATDGTRITIKKEQFILE